MLCITAPRYTDPSKYELSRLPVPTLSEPTEILIEVHAASINPIDVKKASGVMKLVLRDEYALLSYVPGCIAHKYRRFPYKIGFDCAGIVSELGSRVTRFKVGDEVYVRLPETSRGSWAEYAKCQEYFIAPKPRSLDFGDAASLPLAAMTALQALRLYKGSLEGKTVFVPAGLSGTGAYACQLAKTVFRAGKVITTVSTAKVPKVPELLGEGVVDQVIDYTKESPTTAIPRGSVDFLLDTTGESMQFLSLMVPSTSSIVSISTLPSGTQLQKSPLMQRPDMPQLPWDVSDQLAKISVVTGATSGVGELLACILSSKNAKVHLAARSASKVEKTIHNIKTEHPASTVQLVFLQLDLNDLSMIKKSVNEFLDNKSKLHVLWNTAGQLGANDLAPFLFPKLLTPLLKETAKIEPVSSARVVRVASSTAADFAPKSRVMMDNLDDKTGKGAWYKCGVSKAGNIFQAVENARRQIGFTRNDIEKSRKAKSEGGNGITEQFYGWNETASPKLCSKASFI
ncbi:hypothetical protein DV736_g132, partial [Chaetothyriales sp. CBS 134916]